MSGRRLTKYKKHTNHATHAVLHSQPHLHRKKDFNAKLLYVALSCVAVLSIAGWAVYSRIQNSTSKTVTTNQASATVALLERVKKQKNSSDAVATQKLIEDILSTPGFSANMDLLYILVDYYINQTNPVEARKYFTNLQESYRGDKAFSEALGTTKSMLQLESDVRFVEVQATNFNQAAKNGLVSQ